MTTKREINYTNIAVNTAIVATVTFLVNLGLFVTFKDMVAYAAPKESVEKMSEQLTRIERKVNGLCEKQHIKVDYEE